MLRIEDKAMAAITVALSPHPKLHDASVNTTFNNIVMRDYSEKAKQVWGGLNIVIL
jgi:hypothetical protein